MRFFTSKNFTVMNETINQPKSYDFTQTAGWLESYPAKEMADSLKDNALALVGVGLEKPDGADPKETVLKMMEAVNFVCSFLDTIKEKEVQP